MFCPNCGIEIKEKMKFCFSCGEKLDFEAVKEKEKNDTKEAEQENKPLAAQDANVEPKKTITPKTTVASNANRKDVPFARQRTSNLTITDKLKNKCKEVWNQLPLFSKVLTGLVAISAFLGLIALLFGKTWSIVIAVLQIGLFVVGWLMKNEKIKQNTKWLPYLSVALAIVLFIPFFGAFSISENTNKSDSKKVSGPLYKIGIEIDCAENLIFSRYNLKILVDSKVIGTLKHGEKSTFNAEVEKGKHRLEVQKADDSSVKGDVDFELNQNSIFKYEVSCKNDKVNIAEMSRTNPPIVVSELGSKSYDDVKKLFTDAGFTNVTTKEIKDLTVDKKDKSNIASNISIDGKSDFAKDTTYYKDAKIEIEYHTFPTNSDSSTSSSTESTTATEEITDDSNTTSNETEKGSEVVLPKSGSKLDNDFDSKSDRTVLYINVDGRSNTPKIAKWGTAVVTDGVSEYIDYLKSLGYSVNVTSTDYREPYSGFHLYKTNFIVKKSSVSWTMLLTIQDEDYVEYELDIHLK